MFDLKSKQEKSELKMLYDYDIMIWVNEDVILYFSSIENSFHNTNHSWKSKSKTFPIDRLTLAE